jgi:hypothetical protein
VATTQKRLIVAAAVLWAVWLVLTWMTGTWKDQTESGQTQLLLWSALSQMVFWVGLVCVTWAVGVSVFRHAARSEQSE